MTCACEPERADRYPGRVKPARQAAAPPPGRPARANTGCVFPGSWRSSRWGLATLLRMLIPGDKEILALHEKHAPSQEAFDLVYTHCVIVCGIAEQLLHRPVPGLDAELVRAGSLLHDIGVYRLYDADGKLDDSEYVRHGLLGHGLLAEEGFPETLCRFASCHTGMGLSREDVRRQGLPVPAADYLAVSAEEQLVIYADKFHSKTSPPVFAGFGRGDAAEAA